MKLEILLLIILVIGLVLTFIIINNKYKNKNGGYPLDIPEKDIITYYPKIEKIDGFDKELLGLVNNHRQEMGLNTVISERLCRDLAYEHVKYMIEKGKPSHDLFIKRRYELYRRGATAFGENVAYGYTSSEGMFLAYLASEGHKKVIETERFTHVGVVTLQDKNNKNYNALMFAEFKQ